MIYTRTTEANYNSKVLNQEWTIVAPPAPWNGFAAVVYVTCKGKELKVVIPNYFVTKTTHI